MDEHRKMMLCLMLKRFLHLFVALGINPPRRVVEVLGDLAIEQRRGFSLHHIKEGLKILIEAIRVLLVQSEALAIGTDMITQCLAHEIRSVKSRQESVRLLTVVSIEAGVYERGMPKGNGEVFIVEVQRKKNFVDLFRTTISTKFLSGGGKLCKDGRLSFGLEC
ncbi:hypothetical protein Cva_01484 [Caedimonas varicaedens]|uniref:Uncharacterized protein n=1 Tax=Caedimonas varicaedens TaxID=1629334 RepID=A0A0K8ME49_9PROT|nr:hypothetical protein Cva_01484 [Caedimonas varicaedens]